MSNPTSTYAPDGFRMPAEWEPPRADLMVLAGTPTTGATAASWPRRPSPRGG